MERRTRRFVSDLDDGMGPLTCDTPGSWGSSAEEDEYNFLGSAAVPPRSLQCTLYSLFFMTRTLYFILELKLSLVLDSSSSHYDEI